VQKEGSPNGKVWILNAGIAIEKDGGLIIDSTDTSWLKIVPTPTIQQDGENDTDTNDDEQDEGTISYAIIRTEHNDSYNYYSKGQKPIIVSRTNRNNPNGIHVFGSLKIDSVKITSWNHEKNEVITFDFGKRLGYSCSRCAGNNYYGGIGSIVKGNNIHHLLKGFYSKGMGAMIVENNTFHDNFLYGIDPHTGTQDMIIRKNKVYRNNASAIICSKHCYNILFEANEVYNNGGFQRGIAFSINTTHSTARNNYVHDQGACIGSNRGSNFNTI